MNSLVPRDSRRPGFTLIELMAVLVIIGILIALAFGISAYATRAARKAKAAAQIEKLANLIQACLQENGALPLSLNEVTNRLPPGFRFDAGTGEPLDPWDHPYAYRTNSAYSFILFSYGPDGTNSSSDKHIVLGR